MTRNLTIRPFRSVDMGAVLRIERASFRGDAWPRELFEQYAAAAPRLFLVARLRGRIAGYTIAVPARTGVEIASIAVSPSSRRQGIATALLRAVIAKARRMGAAALLLMVRRSNAEAIQVYRRLGFRRVATVHGYYSGRSAGWRMRLAFSEPRQ